MSEKIKKRMAKQRAQLDRQQRAFKNREKSSDD